MTVNKRGLAQLDDAYISICGAAERYIDDRIYDQYRPGSPSTEVVIDLALLMYETIYPDADTIPADVLHHLRTTYHGAGWHVSDECTAEGYPLLVLR